jgi:outer membrane protein insertion porin family
LGCFSDVDIHIDTADKGENSDYEVTFKVTELKRIVGSVNTMVGNQEGSLMLGLKLPNLVGKGERFQVDYSHGTKKTNQFNAR